jgi:ubiquinone/menaquinone biosynthesis C-methylase UbiE
MTRQIAESQTKLLESFLCDSSVAIEIAKQDSHARISDWLQVENRGNILELGCGPGKYVALLSSLGFNVTGVDPYQFESWNTIESHKNVMLSSGVYAENLPFHDDQFDNAVCLGALLYFESPITALKELSRVVKPGGRIVLRTVNRNNLYTKITGNKLDPASKNLYTMDELKLLVKSAGYEVHSAYSYGFWPPVLTNLWWYIVCVWLPQEFQDLLSRLCPPANRVNNIMFLSNNK